MQTWITVWWNEEGLFVAQYANGYTTTWIWLCESLHSFSAILDYKFIH